MNVFTKQNLNCIRKEIQQIILTTLNNPNNIPLTNQNLQEISFKITKAIILDCYYHQFYSTILKDLQNINVLYSKNTFIVPFENIIFYEAASKMFDEYICNIIEKPDKNEKTNTSNKNSDDKRYIHSQHFRSLLENNMSNLQIKNNSSLKNKESEIMVRISPTCFFLLVKNCNADIGESLEFQKRNFENIDEIEQRLTKSINLVTYITKHHKERQYRNSLPSEKTATNILENITQKKATSIGNYSDPIIINLEFILTSLKSFYKNLPIYFYSDLLYDALKLNNDSDIWLNLYLINNATDVIKNFFNIFSEPSGDFDYTKLFETSQLMLISCIENLTGTFTIKVPCAIKKTIRKTHYLNDSMNIFIPIFSPTQDIINKLMTYSIQLREEYFFDLDDFIFSKNETLFTYADKYYSPQYFLNKEKINIFQQDIYGTVNKARSILKEYEKFIESFHELYNSEPLHLIHKLTDRAYRQAQIKKHNKSW